jgi:hypothetical protein
MLNTAKNFLSQAPWMAVWPGLAIFSLVLSFNLLGDGLRDALSTRVEAEPAFPRQATSSNLGSTSVATTPG